MNELGSWPQPLPPSEAFAVRQVLDLALESSALQPEDIFSRALRIGHFTLAQRVLDIGQSENEIPRDPECRIDRFTRMTKHLEGLIFYLGDHIDDYLDALQECEANYFERIRATTTLAKDFLLPTLSDLQGWASCAEDGRDGSHEVLSRWGHSFEGYQCNYSALAQLLPILFYVDTEFVHSDTGQRLTEQVDRWLCYWVCNNNRYGECQSNHRQEEVAL